MAEEQTWYTNKDLYEQINALRFEMQETRNVIKQYNGLREKLDVVEDKVEKMEFVTLGKNKVLTAIREWGGWIVAILAFVINYLK